ncbi:MAG: hybrid sensor histidine kinase/response regulator [Bacillota bacterium]
MVIIGVVTGLIFWLLISFTDAYIIPGIYNNTYLHPTLLVFISHSVVFFLVFIFSWYSHSALKSLNKTKEALKQSEEKYRTIIEHSNDIIWVLDGKGSLTFLNDKAKDVTGYSLEDIQGNIFMTHLNIDSSSDLIQDFLNAKTDKSMQFEASIFGKDGSRVLMSINTTPIIRAGKVTSLVCFGRDITRQKIAEKALQDSEERYRQMVELFPDAILMHSDGLIIFANSALAKLLCLEKPEELIGTPVSDFIQRFVHPTCQIEVKKRVNSLINYENSTPLIEEKYIRCDGEVVYVEVAASSYVFREKFAVQVVIRDITDRKKFENELLKADKLEAMGILAGGIAHDFNNILTVILGNASLTNLYIRAGENDKIPEKMNEINEATKQAKKLTQQLLTFAKGGLPVKKIVNARDLIKETSLFSLSGTNVLCRFSIEDNIWPVEVDEGQISQVIHNLIINAVQAMPEGGTIQIKAENTMIDEDLPGPKFGPYVMITIEDKGIGISEKHLQKIFDPYFTTKQAGSGLGLATSYAIVIKHDGYISVKSQVGIGTTFYIYLPAMPTLNPESNTLERDILMGKGKVLVIDDEEAVGKVAGEMLRGLGYEVHHASSGEEGIKVYKNAWETGSPFVLIIMDLTIPGGIGGKETIKRLMKFNPDIKAIVSSGYSNDPVMANFTQYGFRGIITKPYQLHELSKAVYKVICGEI